MGKAQIEELKSQCAANSPWYPATDSVANGIEVVVMASAMSDLFHRQLCGREFGPSDFRSGSGPPKRGRFRRCAAMSAVRTIAALRGSIYSLPQTSHVPSHRQTIREDRMTPHLAW